MIFFLIKNNQNTCIINTPLLPPNRPVRPVVSGGSRRSIAGHPSGHLSPIGLPLVPVDRRSLNLPPAAGGSDSNTKGNGNNVNTDDDGESSAAEKVCGLCRQAGLPSEMINLWTSPTRQSTVPVCSRCKAQLVIKSKRQVRCHLCSFMAGSHDALRRHHIMMHEQQQQQTLVAQGQGDVQAGGKTQPAINALPQGHKITLSRRQVLQDKKSNSMDISVNTVLMDSREKKKGVFQNVETAQIFTCTDASEGIAVYKTCSLCRQSGLPSEMINLWTSPTRQSTMPVCSRCKAQLIIKSKRQVRCHLCSFMAGSHGALRRHYIMMHEQQQQQTLVAKGQSDVQAGGKTQPATNVLPQDHRRTLVGRQVPQEDGSNSVDATTSSMTSMEDSKVPKDGGLAPQPPTMKVHQKESFDFEAKKESLEKKTEGAMQKILLVSIEELNQLIDLSCCKDEP